MKRSAARRPKKGDKKKKGCKHKKKKYDHGKTIKVDGITLICKDGAWVVKPKPKPKPKSRRKTRRKKVR